MLMHFTYLKRNFYLLGQRVDYFDKRVMEVIKHWLSSSVDQYAMNAHDCTFRGEVSYFQVYISFLDFLLLNVIHN